jgi:parallel beta-helix repeat protein
MNRTTKLLAIILVGAFVWEAGPLLAMTYHVYPLGTGRTGGDKIYGLSQFEWSRAVAGDIFLLYDDLGSFKETITVYGKGSSDRPIVIKPAPSELPVIDGTLVLTGAAHVNIEGLTVANSPYAGVIIKTGSHHVSVSRCAVKDNALGIWIGDGAGMKNRVTDNEVSFNKTHGIAVDRLNCSPGKETIIGGNRVFENGHHGIEINGSYYVIEKNEVFNNGKDLVGTSGIHIYSLSPDQDSGDHNIIRYNVSHHHTALSGADGNGIQLDQWCDFNQVYYNICFANDGAGINIFDSSNDYIYNNTLYGNMLDPGKNHPIKAELILASDFKRNVDHTNKIVVANNIIVATGSSNYAIYVDRLTSDNRLKIERNLFYHTQGTAFYFWNGQTGKDVWLWNRFPGSATNVYGDPQFVHSPASSPADFALGPTSPAIDAGKRVGLTTDILGQAVPQGTSPDLGAIESQPATAPSMPKNPGRHE